MKRVDRDDITGEILQGGNTMLFIEYEYGIFEEVAREWMATAKGLMQSKAEVTKFLMVCICSIRPLRSAGDQATGREYQLHI